MSKLGASSRGAVLDFSHLQDPLLVAAARKRWGAVEARKRWGAVEAAAAQAAKRTGIAKLKR